MGFDTWLQNKNTRQILLEHAIFMHLTSEGWALKLQNNQPTLASSTQKLLVLLRDGRKLVGVLRSFDQFANVVLERSIERIIVGDLFCDLPLGLYVIRGENVVLIGELDPDKDELPSDMVRVSPADIQQAQKAERDATELKGTMRKRMEFLDLD